MGFVIRAHTQALVFVKKNIWYTGTFFLHKQVHVCSHYNMVQVKC